MRRRLVAAVVMGSLGWWAGGPVVAIALVAGWFVVPSIIERQQRAVAARHLGRDLATMLEVAARLVRTGSPLPEALARAAELQPGSAGCRLAALAERMRCDHQRDAVTAWAVECADPATDTVAAVVAMVSGTGGGAVGGLEAGATLLRERERTHDEVAAGASHARASARLLVVLPVLFGSAAIVVVPGGVTRLLGQPLVALAVGAGSASIAAGAWWTRKMVGGLGRGVR